MNTSTNNNTPQPLPYLLARLAIAASMFGHGLVRLPKLQGFSNWMVESFSTSMMPLALVKPFSLVLPIVEFITGLLLIAGLFTRTALMAGSIAMLSSHLRLMSYREMGMGNLPDVLRSVLRAAAGLHQP